MPEVILLVAVGAVVTGLAAWELRRARNAANWPSVRGRMLSARVVDGPERLERFPVAVSYAYEVNGVSYRGERIRFGATEDSPYHEAMRRADRFRPGRAVRVFYNPTEPSDSVLGTRPSRGIVIQMGIGIALLASGIVALFGLFR